MLNFINPSKYHLAQLTSSTPTLTSRPVGCYLSIDLVDVDNAGVVACRPEDTKFVIDLIRSLPCIRGHQPKIVTAIPLVEAPTIAWQGPLTHLVLVDIASEHLDLLQPYYNQLGWEIQIR